MLCHDFLRKPGVLCNPLCMTTQSSDLLVPEFDLADRMRKALRISNVGVQEIADYLGVARNTVSTWINGRIEPSTQTLRLWALRCGVSYEWLRSGESAGEPSNDPSEVQLPRLDSNQQPFDDGATSPRNPARPIIVALPLAA
jgi:transcriptional regulator with XRE-family HTH domain